jgi:hypothetical protein
MQIVFVLRFLLPVAPLCARIVPARLIITIWGTGKGSDASRHR